MNKKQYDIMKKGKGFIAALDQSGGSTPKALEAYGIAPDQWDSEEKMFELVHAMRSRMITSPSFSSGRILAAILFERTMDSRIEGKYSADYLWEEKGIVPFLKIDKGLAAEERGVHIMKPMPGLEALLDRAVDRNIFGTKMRSVIHSADRHGIRRVVDQQFETAAVISAKGLVPIIEPEVDIRSSEKALCEQILREEIMSHLDRLGGDTEVMLKISIPDEDNFYAAVMEHPRMLRVVA